MKFVNSRLLLTIFGVGASVCTMGAILIDGMFGLYSLVLISLFMSIMFPSIYGIALENVETSDTNLGAAFLVMSIVGGAILPPLQGALIDQQTILGMPAVNFLNLMPHERVTTIIPFRDFRDDKYLIAVTKNGTIKKTAISQFDNNRKTGLIAITLKDGDELVGIKQTSGTDNVIIITRQGKCICFSEEDVRPMGRIAGGVRAIKLEKDPLPGPSYCSDKLVFHEDHWDVPPEDKDLFNSMAARFYNNLYDALTTGAALAIPPEQVLQQIAIIEECHKQNPLPKKY
jgi:hypothetical protein